MQEGTGLQGLADRVTPRLSRLEKACNPGLGVRAGGPGESLGVGLPPPDARLPEQGLLWSRAPSLARSPLWDFCRLPPASPVSAPLGRHSLTDPTGEGKCPGPGSRAPGGSPGSAPTLGSCQPSYHAGGSLSFPTCGGGCTRST